MLIIFEINSKILYSRPRGHHSIGLDLGDESNSVLSLHIKQKISFSTLQNKTEALVFSTLHSVSNSYLCHVVHLYFLPQRHLAHEVPEKFFNVKLTFF